MRPFTVYPPATIWMVDASPIRMPLGGQLWRVSDTPTSLRDSIWVEPYEENHGLYGWRFQATEDDGGSLVFDVFKEQDGWHVHHPYD